VLIRYPYYGISISCISNIWSASGFVEGPSARIEVYNVFLIFRRQFGQFDENWMNCDNDDDSDIDNDDDDNTINPY
jgi:hypothetical protein